MSYRVLVLPDRASISLPVLRKIRELVAAGATVVGPKPARATGLRGFPACDQEVTRLADEMWNEPAPGASRGGHHRFGAGRVFQDTTAREVLLADGVPPDFEFTGGTSGAVLDYLHRTTEEAEIYYVASRSSRFESISCAFRVTQRVPELWNPVTGGRRFLPVYAETEDRVTVPLEFAPYGSWFVVFRNGAAATSGTAGARNFPVIGPCHEIGGSWQVKFDPDWGGPEIIEFDQLIDWTQHPEPGIRHYSGTATYGKRFVLSTPMLAEHRADRQRLLLDLGELRQLAEVRLNGRGLGVLWCPPFRVDVTEILRPGENALEIDIVNFWPNRIIGDAALAPEARRTRTNIRKLGEDTPLVRSGLYGPVRLLKAGGTVD
jgi:hypothetical protein